MLATVFDDALVLFGPDFFEQWALGGDIGVGIQNQHLATRFHSLEVTGNHRGPLVRTGWAAIRCLRDSDGVHAAVGHGLQLLSECHGLGTGLPRLQDLPGGIGLLQAFNAAKHQFNAWRHHQFVVGDAGTTGKGDGFFCRINGTGVVLDDGDAVVPGQACVGRSEVTHLLATGQYQVGNGA